MDAIEEVGRTAEALRGDLELLLVRGLASSTPKDRRSIELRAEEWERTGASHVAERLVGALRAIDADAKDAPRKLLSAYTSLHTFERVLSLDAAVRAWSPLVEGEVPEHAPATAPAPAPLDDPKGVSRVLTDLVKVVEDLVRTGLTNASEATRTRLDAAFKEAARRKLLRLGASLRYVNEEIGRFLADDGSFAARRYGFFLHRAWLLSKGTELAIARGDARLSSALTVGAAAAPKPIKTLEVVTLGIGKRTIASACTFDFRLKVLAAPDAALVGRILAFGLVFARKEGVIAEAFLHLPQPQKYAPKILREHERLVVTDAAVVPDDRGGGRLLLGPKSTVTKGSKVDDWSLSFDPAAALARARAHAITPLDLAVELQEEVVLDEYQFDDAASVVHGKMGVFHVTLEGQEPRERLAKAKDARLFGLVHYEGGRLVLQPLSLLGPEGPEHLQLSNETINLSALVGSLNIG